MSFSAVACADRNLNPKAACIKRRDEEKLSIGLDGLGPSGLPQFDLQSLIGGAGNNGLPPPPQASLSSFTNCPSPSTSNMGLTQQQPLSTSYSRPLSYTPSPPSVSALDKIPRKSDPPMKRRSSPGNLSPTFRKGKGRLSVMNSLVLSSPKHSDLPMLEPDGILNPVTTM